MVELALLALMNRLTNWGRAPVIATRAIAADAATLRALVADPAGQGRLLDGVSPLLRPRAHVEPRRSTRLVSVRVQLRRRDALWVTWILTPRRGTTEVDLAAQPESRSVLARLALLLGGRRWLRRRLERTLGVLAALAHCAAEDLGGIERDAVLPSPPRAAIDGAGDAALPRPPLDGADAGADGPADPELRAAPPRLTPRGRGYHRGA